MYTAKKVFRTFFIKLMVVFEIYKTFRMRQQQSTNLYFRFLHCLYHVLIIS